MAEAGSYDLKSVFNSDVVTEWRNWIENVDSSFDGEAFETMANDGLEALELKPRSAHIAAALKIHLPNDFATATSILIQALGAEEDKGDLEGMGSFRLLPALDYVERYGLDYPETALDALEKLTVHFSGEWAIRPYILEFPDLALPCIIKWSKHANWRVRRLASEGTRPRLPWGIQLKPFIKDPKWAVELLNQMHGDDELIVRRSVANNLNDIAKDHPDLAAETAQKWWDTNSELSRWTAKHGLRTLIKQGHPKALAVLGFTGGDNINVEAFEMSDNEPLIGGQMDFSFDLCSQEKSVTKMVVDYALHRTLANGKSGSKIFKLANLTMKPNARQQLGASVKFKQLSTRTYYAGLHAIEIFINGQSKGKWAFQLSD